MDVLFSAPITYRGIAYKIEVSNSKRYVRSFPPYADHLLRFVAGEIPRQLASRINLLLYLCRARLRITATRGCYFPVCGLT